MVDVTVTAVEKVGELSQTINGWSLAAVGGSIAAILGSIYHRPRRRSARAVYALFLPAWVLLGISLYFGSVINRRLVAFHYVDNETVRNEISNKLNTDFGIQLDLFQIGLCFLFLWLILYLAWWIWTEHGDDA